MRFVGDGRPVDLPVLQASSFGPSSSQLNGPKPPSRQRWKQPASCPLEREDYGLVAWYRSLYAPRTEGRMTVTIGRRELLAALGGAAAGWPLAARAQQMRRIRRIGVLMSTTSDDVEGQARIAAFLKGLQQWGWAVPGNVRIDTRWGAGDADRIRKYAAELVALAPDVILASGGAVAGPLLQL